ncbi:MAG TPA: lipocalin-like domain-containing protein [Candidatus Baltobacteraceae bacterium]|nr:lipocalin-like domain-containing protein [Candidatus Baltobacteraceae bacterium]
MLTAGAALTAAEGPFRQALPGYAFSFPRDHFSHDDYRTEWWYYTGHLTSSGKEYGYELTFFRSGLAENRANPSRWAAKNLYLAHFAVSDIARKSFRYFERIGRAGVGQAGAGSEQLRVWVGDWELSGDGATARLKARDDGFGMDLTLTAQKPPAIHGANGVSQKGEGRGRASHYYSCTRLKTEGTMTVAGAALPVTGSSWMDHEFGSTELAPDQVGWDWFSLQLEDGNDLMLYMIRKKDGQPDPYSAGTWVSTDGTTTHLRQSDFSVDVLERWTSPHSQGVYPMKWRLRVPKLGLEAVITPAFPDQELITTQSTQVTYWEGAAHVDGTLSGRSLKGKAYVEMTGYAGPFRKRL